eukprot:6686044-Prymnesium_polylepis.1
MSNGIAAGKSGFQQQFAHSSTLYPSKMAHNGGADSEQENAQRHMRKLSLVRIVSSNLNFGCMTGLLEGTDIPVTLALLTSRKQRLLGGWPRVGDIVGCEHVAHSVYEPRESPHFLNPQRSVSSGRLKFGAGPGQVFQTSRNVLRNLQVRCFCRRSCSRCSCSAAACRTTSQSTSSVSGGRSCASTTGNEARHLKA